MVINTTMAIEVVEMGGKRSRRGRKIALVRRLEELVAAWRESWLTQAEFAERRDRRPDREGERTSAPKVCFAETLGRQAECPRSRCIDNTVVWPSKTLIWLREAVDHVLNVLSSLLEIMSLWSALSATVLIPAA